MTDSYLTSDLIGDRAADQGCEQLLQNLEKMNKVLNANIEITSILLSIFDDQMFGRVLNIIIRIAACDLGLFGYIDNDNFLVIPSLHGEVWDKCQMQNKTIKFPLEGLEETVWGRAIRDRQTLCTNEALTVPVGHIRISNAAVSPIVFDGKTIGIIMIANKAGSIKPYDLELLKSITDHLAPALNAWQQMIRDNLKRAEMEVALNSSNRRFKEISEMMRSGVVMLEAVDEGSNFIVRYFNRAAERIDQLHREDILGRRLRDLLPSIEKYGLLDILRQVYKTGEPAHHPVSFYQDDRISGWREIYVYKLSSSEIVCVYEDCTQQILADNTIRESEQKYRCVVENIGIGIATISPQMEILSLNKQMSIWFPDIDILSKQICYEAFNNPKRLEKCSYCPTYKTLQDGQIYESITQTPTEKGIRHFRIKSSPIMDAQSNVIAAVEMVEDITDRLRNEEELIKLEKVESLELMAGGIAHDFNNILTSIIGNIVLAKMNNSQVDKLTARLENAEKAANRAKIMMQQLMNFAKGGVPEQKVIEIAPVIQEAVESGLVGSSTKVNYNIVPELLPVRANSGQIMQVIQNLVVNAVQAMSKGGIIDISADNTHEAKGIKASYKSEHYVIITVTDHGCGIEPDNLKRIFDPYYTTKAKGNGLGLATSSSIIKRHGGKIDVVSKVGIGTTFTLKLPACTKVSEEGPNIPEEDTVEPGRILILDDDEFICEIAVEILKQDGHDIHCVGDGNKAIAEYKRAIIENNPYDVIILDFMIAGGKGGFEIMDELKMIDTKVSTIASSGESVEKVIELCKQHGITAHVSKPFQHRELSQIVRQVLKQRLQSQTLVTNQ